MLDDFILEQKIAYKTIINSVKLDKISHAYIIESNGFSKSYNFALALAKYILCPNHYSNIEKCLNCFQCKNIDNNDFLELKVIDPAGMWIKKSELQELQEIFSKKSIVGNKKVYIINNAHKLNDSSSNSILKFLEEPSDGITAILIVDNIYQLLSTIVSRCQVISLFPNHHLEGISSLEKIARCLKNNEESIKEYVDDQNSLVNVNHVIDFIKYYEENKLNTILNVNKLFHQFFKERNEIYDAFTIMILYYKDVLNCFIGKKITIFTDYEDNIKKMCDVTNKNILINKINVIINLREKILFNVNNNLLLDKLIIELEGCDNT